MTARSWARIAAATTAAMLASTGLIATAPVAFADGGCSGYGTFDATAAATGVATSQSAPGVTIVDSADGSLPAAQAQVDSVTGSNAFAGAPYSQTVAGNLGAAGASPNQVPVFATSAYPAQPSASQSTPAAALNAKSEASGSSATVSMGGTSRDPSVPADGVNGAASAKCGGDGSLTAVADDLVRGLNIASVLRVASVRTHAKATRSPNGHLQLEGTVDIEGASVLGQPVSITDHGIVVGPMPLPGATNPLQAALTTAGITARSVSATKDSANGQVLSGALEIVVKQKVPNVGIGPVTTTYTLGRGYATTRATGSPAGVDAPAASTGAPAPATPTALPPAIPLVSAQVAPTPALTQRPATGRSPTTTNPTQPLRRMALELIGGWSIAPAYLALALGTLILLFGRFAFEKIAARFEWI